MRVLDLVSLPLLNGALVMLGTFRAAAGEHRMDVTRPTATFRSVWEANGNVLPSWMEPGALGGQLAMRFDHDVEDGRLLVVLA